MTRTTRRYVPRLRGLALRVAATVALVAGATFVAQGSAGAATAAPAHRGAATRSKDSTPAKRSIPPAIVPGNLARATSAARPRSFFGPGDGSPDFAVNAIGDEPSTGYYLGSSIQCFDSSNCLSAGGSLTSDGGKTWTSTSGSPCEYSCLPTPCVSEEICYSIEEESQAETDGYYDWDVFWPELEVSTNGGQSWSESGTAPPVAETDGGAYALAMDCPAEGTCDLIVAMDSYPYEEYPDPDPSDETWQTYSLSTTDGGSTWTSGSLPDSIADQSYPTGASDTFGVGMSCPSTSECVAVWPVTSADDPEQATPTPLVSNGAGNWSASSFPSDDESSTAVGQGVSTVQCPTTSDCYVLFDNGDSEQLAFSSDGGEDWADAGSSVATLQASPWACPAAGTCYVSTWEADGAAIYSTVNGGNDWSSESLPWLAALAGSVFTLACGSATSCVGGGVGGEDFYTTDGGASWVASYSSFPTMEQMACPSADVCVAVGGGVALSSSDGGGSWTAAPTTPLVAAQLYDESELISCPSSSTACVVVGYDGAGTPQSSFTTDGGGSWAAGALPLASGQNPDDLDCPSTAACYLSYFSFDGGGAGLLFSDNLGASWSSLTVPAGMSALSAISCADASDCTAAGFTTSGGALAWTADGGADWTTTVIPADLDQFDYDSPSALDCPVPSTCYVVSDGGLFVAASYGSVWMPEIAGATESAHITMRPGAAIAAGGALAAGAAQSTGEDRPAAGRVPAPVLAGPLGTTRPSPRRSPAQAQKGRPVQRVTSRLTTVPASGSVQDVSCSEVFDCVMVAAGELYSTVSLGIDWGDEGSAPGDGYQPILCNSGGECGESSSGTTAYSSWMYELSGLVPPGGGPILPAEDIGGTNGSEPCYGCYLKHLGMLPVEVTGGDPVNTATGELSENYTDFDVATIGPALSLTRTYDSALAGTSGPFGPGWTDDWAMSLELADPTSPLAGDVTVLQEDGSQVAFAPETEGLCPPPLVQAGQWCASPRVLATLSYANGVFTLARTQTSMTYTFATPPPGSSTAPLQSETDRSGNELTLTPDSPAPGAGGCPSAAGSCETIESASGRSLVLAWSGSGDGGEVSSVSDPLGRTYSYGYCATESATCAPGDLVSVTDPMGHVTSYAYCTSLSTGYGTSCLAGELTGITEPNAQRGGPDANDSWSFAYDASGRVVSESDPMGRTTTYSYRGDNFADDGGSTTMTDPDGVATEYLYYDGVLSGTETAAGATDQQSVIIGHDSVTSLPTSSLDATGRTRQVTYDPATAEPSSETSPNGNTATATYNAYGEPTCQSSPLVATSCATLTPPAAQPPGTITTLPQGSDPPKGVTYFDYGSSGDDQAGDLLYEVTSTGSSAAARQATYYLYAPDTITVGNDDLDCPTTPPAGNLPCLEVNGDGGVTYFGYDAAGDLTSATDPDGDTTTYGYDGDGERTAAVPPDGNVAGGDPALYTTTTGYDADGEVTSLSSGLPGSPVYSRTTTTTYDADGNATSVTNALGETTATAYDADDEPTLVTDADGHSTLTCYDGDGQVTQTVPPAGVAGDPPSVPALTPSSCPSEYPADFGERLAADATTDSYDSTGQLVATTTPAPAGESAPQTTEYAYDQAGRLVETISPPSTGSYSAPGSDDGTIDTYDADGNLTAQTTGLSVASDGVISTTSATATVSYCYDQADERTASVPGDGNAGLSRVSSGGVVSGFVCDPNPADDAPTTSDYATSYTYDDAGQLLSQHSPELTQPPGSGGQSATASESFTYDGDGNRLTTTDFDGGVTTDRYDLANRLQSESQTAGATTAAATTVAYAYDADGNTTSMQSAGAAATTSIYDPFGELTSESDAAGQTVSYAYDQAGEQTAISYPLPSSASWAQNDVVADAYDPAGNLVGVTDFSGTQSRVTLGDDELPTSTTLGVSGDTVTTSYDSADEVAGVALGGSGGQLWSACYDRMPDGEIATEDDTGDAPCGTPSQSYAFDNASRVQNDQIGSSNPSAYAYDASDALTTLPDGSSASLDPYSSELTGSNADGGTTYAYDANGDRASSSTASATTTTAWNGEGELTSIATPNLTEAATYDGGGLRASATITPSGGQPATEDFAWNTTGSTPSLLVDGSNAYLYDGGSAPFEQVSLTTGSVSYLVADALGSIRAVVSSSGALAGSTFYDAWGNPQSSGTSALTPFGFAGGYTDPSGLVYLVHRYYDPATGQFLSVDPLVDQTGQPYSYGADDPVDATDSSGELWQGTGSGNCVQTSVATASECPVSTPNGLMYPNCGALPPGAVPAGECAAQPRPSAGQILGAVGDVLAGISMLPGLPEDALAGATCPFLDELAAEGGASSVPAQLLRGQQFEADSLQELGLTKNGAGGGQISFNGSIPDSIDQNGDIWEFKDTQTQYYTKQLQNFVASGRPVNLVLGPNTVVSGPLEQAIDSSGGAILVREASGVFEPYYG